MKKKLLIVLGAMAAVVVALLVFFPEESYEDRWRDQQGDLRRKRRDWVEAVRYEVNSISAISLSGKDGDVLEVDFAGCDRGTLRRMNDMPKIRDSLSALQFSAIRCRISGEELPIVWR